MNRIVLLAAIALCACGAGGERSATKTANEAHTRERTAYRQAVGGLGAGYLYQTYLVIGTTADLLGSEAIESADAIALMQTTLGMSRNVDEILSGVHRLPIGPNDAATVSNMVRINRLLAEQAESLQAFAKSGAREDAMQFEARRKETWQHLSRLLNVPLDP